MSKIYYISGFLLALITLIVSLHILRLTPGECNNKKHNESLRGVIALASILTVINLSYLVCQSTCGMEVVMNNNMMILLGVTYLLFFCFLMVLYSAMDSCVSDKQPKSLIMFYGILSLLLSGISFFKIYKSRL
jgi:hypothetical protein